MIELYSFFRSGHAHRVRLFLGLLGVKFALREINLLEGENRTPEYLQLNPLGQVPTLVDDGLVVTDSTAILVYLAKRYGDTGWLPEEAREAADVERWLSVASGALYRGVVLARARTTLGKPGSVDDARAEGIALVEQVEHHLCARDWLVGKQPTIADVALYSYLSVAEEGGISLQPRARLRAWLGRVEDLPGFVPMVRTRRQMG